MINSTKNESSHNFCDRFPVACITLQKVTLRKICNPFVVIRLDQIRYLLGESFPLSLLNHDPLVVHENLILFRL